MKRVIREVSAVIGTMAAAALCAALVFRTALPDRFVIVGEDSELSIVSRGYLSADIGEIEGGEGEAAVRLLGCVAVKNVRVTVLEENSVIVSGAPIGIKLFTEGAVIVGITEVNGEDGLRSPAQEAGLRIGDVIIEADGRAVSGNEQFSEAIANGGENIPVKYRRDGVVCETVLTPAKLKEGGYRAGIWVRDSAAGIGTLTFYLPSEGRFAGLGHAVCDVDTGQILPLRSGEIVNVLVTGVVRGRAGRPGELTGTFAGGGNIGVLEQNNSMGIYGRMDAPPEGMAAELALRNEVSVGPATIFATVEGAQAKEYAVYIEKVNLTDRNPTKNIVIRIDDQELLEKTGGIVQGMSGSPIMQNGKLVGAVTHVFVNDPTRGYGIFAENMLDNIRGDSADAAA